MATVMQTQYDAASTMALMRQLLESGVHFGHQTKRWNPKMRPYIFSERNGIHIIDLQQTAGGMRGMTRVPEAIFIVDPRREELAVREARRLEIPILAMVDTNSDPDLVDYVIPSNDDAIRSVRLLTKSMADAALEGRQQFYAA